MKNEVVELLIKDLDGIYVDCTVGFGGHSHKILNTLIKRWMVYKNKNSEFQ